MRSNWYGCISFLDIIGVLPDRYDFDLVCVYKCMDRYRCGYENMDMY